MGLCTEEHGPCECSRSSVQKDQEQGAPIRHVPARGVAVEWAAQGAALGMHGMAFTLFSFVHYTNRYMIFTWKGVAYARPNTRKWFVLSCLYCSKSRPTKGDLRYRPSLHGCFYLTKMRKLNRHHLVDWRIVLTCGTTYWTSSDKLVSAKRIRA